MAGLTSWSKARAQRRDSIWLAVWSAPSLAVIPTSKGPPYRGDAISLFHGRWSRLVMQATYVENASVNPHSFFPGEGVVFLTPADRSLDGRQKSVRALQSGAIRSSAFLDRVGDYRQAAEVYRSLQDEKDRIFSAVCDWTKS